MRWSCTFSSDLPADTPKTPSSLTYGRKLTPIWIHRRPQFPTWPFVHPLHPPFHRSSLSNLVLPYDSVLSAKEVDMVIIPATTGQMGVLPGHVATIAKPKPGVISVHDGNDVTKYFLSSRFAFVHANSITDIVAIEPTPVDRIDLKLVQNGLVEFQQKLSSTSSDLEKAKAQIGVDVHSALNAALTG